MPEAVVKPDMAAFQVRRHQARRRRVRRALIAALIAAVVGGLVWTVGFSTVLAVRQVKVEGASLVGEDVVTAAAAVPMGTPLARVSQKQVADRVTAAVPEVASLTVLRHWPHTLVIKVTQRTIVYQVSVPGGYGWVSSDGLLFHTTPDAQPVPTATVDVNNPALLSDVAAVVKAFPTILVSRLQSVNAPTRDSIVLQLNDGRQVVWGSAEQSDVKARVLLPLLNVPGSVYDVSAPSNPAVR